jgi:hypothetical protein
LLVDNMQQLCSLLCATSWKWSWHIKFICGLEHLKHGMKFHDCATTTA